MISRTAVSAILWTLLSCSLCHCYCAEQIKIHSFKSSTNNIFLTKFFRGVGRLTSNKPLDFGADPDHDPDPGIFSGIFSNAELLQEFWGISCLSVRELGVLLDSSLSMRRHIAKVASTCFYHLRPLRRSRRVLDIQSRKRLVCAFVLTRIDYCNAVLANLPDSALAPLSIAASATSSSSVCGWPWDTRSCHVYTHFVALVTNPSTNDLQTV